MSFFSLLMGAGVLPADIDTAGVTTAARVYPGRQARKVQSSAVEVWVEEMPMPESRGTGFQHVLRYEARIHVRVMGHPGPDGTGDEMRETVEAHLETLRNRYDAAVLFVSTFAGMQPAVALVEQIDEDPEDEGTLDGVLRVTFGVKE